MGMCMIYLTDLRDHFDTEQFWFTHLTELQHKEIHEHNTHSQSEIPHQQRFVECHT
jgi:hypothetical protein